MDNDIIGIAKYFAGYLTRTQRRIAWTFCNTTRMFYYKIVSNASYQGPLSIGADWAIAPPMICLVFFFFWICKSTSYVCSKSDVPITHYAHFLLSHVFKVSSNLKSHPFLILISILKVLRSYNVHFLYLFFDCFIFTRPFSW